MPCDLPSGTSLADIDAHGAPPPDDYCNCCGRRLRVDEYAGFGEGPLWLTEQGDPLCADCGMEESGDE